MTILQITDRSYASKTCQKILGLLLNNASFCYKMIVVVVLLPVFLQSKTRASVSWSKAFPVTFIELSPKLMFTVSVKAEEDGSQLS